MKQAALLVLDNFEHLVAQPYAAELAAEILQRFANIKILCTSRERLNLHGEWVYELHGLPVPLSSYANSLEDSSAAVLFIACARRVDAKFELAEADKPALVRICHLVEGIPLAIELAAAWVDVLACCEIAREIETNIDFLSTSMRDMPARHRSLRATFDHSWRLLSDAERGVLSRLAVFHGGFDRAAAQAVAGASLPLLSALVSKSLVRRTQDGRYDLHEVIRQYAPSHLHKDQSASFATRDRHCEHFLQLVGRHEKDLNGPAQQAAMRELSRELDNIRTAWVWGIERNQTSLLLASVRGLMWMYMVAGLLAEGIEQLELLIQAFKVERPDEHGVKLLGMALSQQAWLSFRKGENLHSQELYQESLAFLRPTGDPTLLMEALIFLGMIAHRNGDYAQAKSLLEEGLACAQAANDTWFAAYAIYNLGGVDFYMGDYQKGCEQALAGLNMWRTIGDPYSIALGLNFLAPGLIALGRYEEARSLMHESIALCEQTKNRWGLGTAYRSQGLVEMACGNLGEAQRLFHKSLDTFGDYIMGWDIARTEIYLGEATRLAGDPIGARAILLNALRIAHDIHSAPLMLDAISGLASLDVRQNPEQVADWLTLVMGHPAATRETSERACQLLSAVERHPGVEQIEGSPENVANQSLEALVETILKPKGLHTQTMR